MTHMFLFRLVILKFISNDLCSNNFPFFIFYSCYMNTAQFIHQFFC